MKVYRDQSRSKQVIIQLVSFYVGLLCAPVLIMTSLIANAASDDQYRKSSSSVPTSAIQDNESEYNFSWLDPEKKVYVLQNRKFKKSRKVSLSLMGGAGFGDTYRQVYAVQPRIGTWFSEDFGVEAFFSSRFHSVNNSYRALVAAAAGTTPLIREIKSQFGLLFNWAPWYAKINVFNTVLYFDWYFSLGAGSMQVDTGTQTRADNPNGWVESNLFAVYAGTGQLFHLSQTFDFRLDFLGHFYSADVLGGAGAASSSSSIFSGLTASVGLGVRL
jgi:outer membrane beta-barrel protein